MSELVVLAPFQPVPGDPTLPRGWWLTLFEDYVLALGHKEIVEANVCACITQRAADIMGLELFLALGFTPGCQLPVRPLPTTAKRRGLDCVTVHRNP